MNVQKQIEKLFTTNPAIRDLLKDADNPRIARDFLIAYSEQIFRILNKEKVKLQPLEWTLQMSCVLTFRRVISVRSERLTKFSICELLWQFAQEKYDELPDDLSEGFFEDLNHLLLGLRGKSGIYDQIDYPDFMDHHGRQAALLRSEQLDKIANKSAEFSKRYISGLDENVIANRRRNKERILQCLGGVEADWQNYLWHIRHVIRNSEQLGNLVQLTSNEKNSIDKAKAAKLPFGITPYYVSLMNYEPHRKYDHAVRAQVIPPMSYVNVLAANSGKMDLQCDFMLENDTSPIDLVTRRYPHIAILKPYNTCSQICVYCQRNWEIDDVLYPKALASKDKIVEAVQWIDCHKAINDVLITGGDPLIMQNDRIEFLLNELGKSDHIERIRIGSRTPVVLPFRITNELLGILSKFHVPGKREIALVTHFEHPYEISPESMQAVQQFKKRGISVYNQTVFTIENSRRFELVTLRRLLRLIGVDPYYTFNTKGKEETKEYRVPLARLQQEVMEEARLIPGLARTDEPVYNVPKLGKNYLRAEQHHSLLSILPNGKRVYEFHPWEKNLSLSDTFVDTDVAIYDYLIELEKRGEKMEDYKTIWYYF